MARTETGAAEAKWAGRIEALAKSGLSLRKFAEREGIKAGTLSFCWRGALRDRHLCAEGHALRGEGARPQGDRCGRVVARQNSARLARLGPQQ
jgi:hypothetical protein